MENARKMVAEGTLERENISSEHKGLDEMSSTKINSKTKKSIQKVKHEINQNLKSNKK